MSEKLVTTIVLVIGKAKVEFARAILAPGNNVRNEYLSVFRVVAKGLPDSIVEVGTELTLVLAGGFSDETGHFLRGDLAEADASVDHRPVAAGLTTAGDDQWGFTE